MIHRAFLTIALSVLIALPAAAQALKINFQNGLVSIDATSAPVRAILTEWEKVGGTKVVGAERLTGAPLTIKLVNVTEAKALETILRNAAGYMAAPRKTGTGSSTYDRILVMATSSTPAAASRPTPQGQNPAPNGGTRFVPPLRPQREQPEAAEQEEPDENPPNPPVFTFPQQGQNGASTPGMITAPPNIGQPVNIAPGGNGQVITISPASPTNTPTMPAGSATPGMIVAPPVPPNQQGVRPPGGIK
jgi:hypothetical protein